MDLLASAKGSPPVGRPPEPLRVEERLAAKYDWTKAEAITLYMNGPSTMHGVRVDVQQVLRESPEHPAGTYLFGEASWMDASEVQRENGKSFLTPCTP